MRSCFRYCLILSKERAKWKLVQVKYENLDDRREN